MKEEWRDIKGYEGLYQVSNLGRVKSLPRMVKRKNGSYSITKEKMLKPSKNKDGYLKVGFNKDGICKKFLVHRLVAMAFIPNPDNLSEINHKDECKISNNVDNLEWCTHEYNLHYGTLYERSSKARFNNPLTSKPVCQYKNGNLIQTYPSIGEAARKCGFNKSAISICCRGLYKQYKGYEWKYV